MANFSENGNYYIRPEYKKYKRIHLYNIENILRPRGGIMQKESLSQLIYEKLIDAFEHWTDPKYSDSMSSEEVIEKIQENLSQEITFALNEFLKQKKGINNEN